MFCSTCGKPHDEAARFCPSCGANFQSAPPTLAKPVRAKKSPWKSIGKVVSGMVTLVIIGLVALGIFVNSQSGGGGASASATSSPSISCDDLAAVKKNAKFISFAELDKNADPYEGQAVVYQGEVDQIQEDSDGSGFMRLAITKKDENFWDDDIYVSYSSHTDAVKGNIRTVYGLLSGTKSYESTANFNITVPAMQACEITVIGNVGNS